MPELTWIKTSGNPWAGTPDERKMRLVALEGGGYALAVAYWEEGGDAPTDQGWWWYPAIADGLIDPTCFDEPLFDDETGLSSVVAVAAIPGVE